ncbi:MAG: pyruvate kinase, partial [Acidobacteriaceae bacterium]|nr:pyruvate kinase [Acidobacteriaceae bacterium]
MRATKIVATLGPSTDPEHILRSLFEAGVDVFRLNVSHGSQQDHARRIKAVREMAARLRVHSGILLDLQGPKIRLGTFKDGPYELKNESIFTITTQPVEGTGEIASTNYPDFARDVRPGDPVLLAD